MEAPLPSDAGNGSTNPDALVRLELRRGPAWSRLVTTRRHTWD